MIQPKATKDCYVNLGSLVRINRYFRTDLETGKFFLDRNIYTNKAVRP